MQNHGGSPAALAIEAPERTFIPSVRVDWNRNGLYDHPLSDLSPYLDEVVIDRGLRGSAPEELLLIEGSAAAELVATLSGDLAGMPFSGVFSPYNPASPLYGKNVMGAEVTYRIGVDTATGVVWYPQFVGAVRTIAPDRGNGGVEVTALDRAELLRRPVVFPTWAVYSRHERSGSYITQLANSQWIIDHCLRACDVSPTPYRCATREEMGLSDGSPTGPQLWVSGTGSILPSIGSAMNDFSVQFPTDASGVAMYAATAPPHPASPEPGTPPLALAATGGPTAEYLAYYCHDRNQLYEEGTHYAGFTLVTTGPNSDYHRTGAAHDVLIAYPGSNFELRININAGKIKSTFRNRTTGPILTSPELTIPTTGTHHRVDVIWDACRPAGARVSLRAGTAATSGFVSAGSALPYTYTDDSLKGVVWVSHRCSLSDIYIASRSTPNPPDTSTALAYRAARYPAVLDQGRNRLSCLSGKSGADAWDILTDVAAAEFGSVFFDENGVFRFWNRDRITSLQSTTARTLTLDEVSGLRLTNSLDSVRNIYSIETVRHRAHQGVVYDARDVDQFYTPGGTQKLFTLDLANVVQLEHGLMSRWNRDGWRAFQSRYGRHAFVVQWLKNGSWTEDDTRADPGVEVRAYFNNDNRIVVEVWNGWPEPCRFATNDGDATFRLGGTIIREESPTILRRKNLASITKYGGRNLELSGDWHQETYDTASLANTMIARTGEPTPTTDAITIAGDPRIQLGDCLRITDPDAMGDLRVQIYGIRRVHSRTAGLTDTLTVELVRPAP